MSIDTLWLDFRLGARLLVKHPVLTLIGAVATTMAIGGGALYFEIVNDFGYPTLPFQGGERVVTIQHDDLETASTERRSLHEVAVWRSELRSVADLAAYTIYSRNVGPIGGQATPTEVVEIGAAAFRIAGIPPLLGRSLLDADERPDSPPVAVIGERLWEARFHRDPSIVGQPIALGSATPTIIGVMPAAFALPVNQSLWVPFRLNPLNYARRQGPAIGTIGRLAPGTTFEGAQAELSVIGARASAGFPDTHTHLRPRIVPYLTPFTGEAIERNVRFTLNLVLMMLAAVICGNVGALVFARIATRENELLVRTALGASRRRIVTQMFVESLVLTSTGAAISLAFLRFGLRRVEAAFWSAQDVARPFWRNDDLNATTILYVVVLTVLGAIVTGALPALRFTKGGLQARLQRAATGASGMRSGGMSTAVIVTQVALCGALLPVALAVALQINLAEPTGFGIRTDEYLTFRYAIEEPAGISGADARAQLSARFTSTYQRLKERLLADGGFSGVTFADQLPGSTHIGRLIEVDGQGSGTASDVQRVRVASVDLHFFDALNASILAGRGFDSGDLASRRDVVIVNQPFVESVLGGRSPIGRRIRYTGADADAPTQWFEIVGVVADLGMSPIEKAEAKGMYHLAAPGELPSGFVALHVGPNPEAAADKVRSIVAAVDPAMLLYDLQPLDEIYRRDLQADRAFFFAVMSGIMFIVLLSAAVTYALMSFTVSQRTREIGIRRALGAGPKDVLTSVFRRAVVQIGLGAALGAAATFAVSSRIPDNYIAKPEMVAVVIAFISAVGFASCIAPVVRAIRIEPTTAIREE